MSKTGLAMTSDQYYPPGALCFDTDEIGARRASYYTNYNCTVMPDMVNFLNLTSTVSGYIASYCLNPPDDDGCPFGYCPNSDIAGTSYHI